MKKLGYRFLFWLILFGSGVYLGYNKQSKIEEHINQLETSNTKIRQLIHPNEPLALPPFDTTKTEKSTEQEDNKISRQDSIFKTVYGYVKREYYKGFECTCDAYELQYDPGDVVDYQHYLKNKDKYDDMDYRQFKPHESYTCYCNDIYGVVDLSAGTPQTYGLSHILARHSYDYFVDYYNKNYNTMFPKGTTGWDILYSIAGFFHNCVEAPLYNRNPNKYIVYLGIATIKHVPYRCILVVDKKTYEIVTFYPLNDTDKDPYLSRNYAPYFD